MINLKNKKLLVIAPHPDDETIGCAGLIQKIKRGGGKAFVLFLTNGDTKDFSKKGISKEKDRIKEIEKVAKLLEIDDYEIALTGNLFHLKLDTVGQNKIMEIIERESKVSIAKSKPDIIAFPSETSYNQDHRIAALSTHAALRPSVKGVKHIPRLALIYEEAADQWSINGVENLNFYLNLTKKEMVKKLKSVKLYKSQVRMSPNMRSIDILEKLARMRGSIIGEKYAEAYKIIRLWN